MKNFFVLLRIQHNNHRKQKMGVFFPLFEQYIIDPF
jgi:hypothetical protein